MNFMKSISRVFRKPRAFLVDCHSDGNGCKSCVETMRSLNIEIDTYTEKELLYTLQCNKIRKYNVGVIHENGSKYSPQILSNFIKKIDPTIKLIIYKNEDELKKQAQILVLT